MARGIFLLAGGLLAWTQVGYGLLLAVLGRGRSAPPRRAVPPGAEPDVSLIVAAYKEEATIAAKVANALELDWPRDRLEVVVAVDGDADDTARVARDAGADVVLELPRGGKIRSQDAAVRAARADLLAFSDANTMWRPDALRELVAAFDDPDVGYACGNVTFLNPDGTNQEGLYWRYELWLRERESRLHSITAGNGAIYATRRTDYLEHDPPMGHDLSFPFRMVRRGRRAVYVAQARAEELMVPTIEGESRRKRRMMIRAWEIILRSEIADVRGYPPLYALMIVSHRLLRYGSPLLHVLALVSALAMAFRRDQRRYAPLALQAALLLAAAAGGRVHARPLLIARYYVFTVAAIGGGLLDYLRHGTPAGWEPAEGTR
jgi:cellulose synthase/poly-beta-1,6-N-acetylglucosamine synthase-like glycosyltransferase